MSAARKSTPGAEAPLTSVALESQCCAAEREVSKAEEAVRVANDALAAAPRELEKRLIAREAVLLAEEDCAAAKRKLDGLRCATGTARRREDEATAATLAEAVGRAAQNKELDAIVKAFEKTVVGAVRDFFRDVTERRADFMLEAEKLTEVRTRLGGINQPNLDLDNGRVSIDTLDAFTGVIQARLRERFQAKDPHERAASLFLAAALEADRSSHVVGRELKAAAHDRRKERKEGAR